MDLYHLRTFLAVADEGNLTRASSKLFLSQPAVSAKIKALEGELGVRLFLRTPQGMTLTPEGKILSGEAQVALKAAKNFMNIANGLRESSIQNVTIATISEPITLRLGQFLALAMATDPNLKIFLKQLTSGQAVEMVRDGEADAGFVIGDYDRGKIIGVKLTDLILNVVGPASWAERLNDTCWHDLADFPWIWTPKGCGFNKISTEVFKPPYKKPKIIVETDHENTLKSLVSNGVGLSFMREDQALKAQEEGLVTIWPHGRVHTYISFICHETSSNKRMLKMVSDLIKNIWEDGMAHIAQTPLKGERLSEYVYLDLD